MPVVVLNNLLSTCSVRMDGWFLMDSIIPTLVLSFSYVIFVTLIGPALMKNREPMQLKTLMQVYNIFQVLLSGYVVYEAFMAGWGTHYSWSEYPDITVTPFFNSFFTVCQPVEQSTDPNGTGMRMARIVYIYAMSKFVEFFDTFFFIARKKFSHVSALQVTHHGIMPIFAFCLTRWVPGGHESFGGFFNSIIHVIMYSYYFMAALGPQFQKYLWWKKYLTSFQMFQFLTVFIKSNIVIWGVAKCGYPWQFSVICASLMVVFFCLFANFYVQEYKAKANKARKEQNGVAKKSN